MKTRHKILAFVVAVALVLVGRWSVGPGDGETDSAPPSAEVAEDTLWSCPMHPQIKLPDPVPCPVCGMDLVPMTGGEDGDPRQLVMSPAAKELARIVAQPVTRKNVTRPVRMVGKIDYDETAVRTISAWVAGRLERIFVDYTGVRVERGDHLVRLYSPELLTAQEELLSARERRVATAGEESAFLASSNRRAYEAAREKLVLWGLTEEQVDEIERRGSAEDHVMLTSPTSGVVIEKFLDEGAYVQTGTHIYKIADLGRLWVRLDAYEQDLAWLRYGQGVSFEVEALPGESFEGTISYIDPFVHETTRTAKVRVNLDNTAGRLKPGMFVRAVAQARLGAGGAVLDRALAGKWVSPMHPEIVKDEAGDCDVCGMALVRAEELGLVSGAVPSSQRPLVVPQSAVLVTGTRAVVYVEVPGAERPTYEGREITLGPRAGDEYIVREGLEEGERVVVNGAFRIDSSMQIQAKPSMMSLTGDGAQLDGPEARLFLESLAPLYERYLALQEALAADDLERALEAAQGLAPEVARPSAAGLPAAFRTRWGEEREGMAGLLERASAQTSLEDLRPVFAELSAALLGVTRDFGYRGPRLHEAYCPMGLGDRGASWLQRGEEIVNPYMGPAMLRCGELNERFGDGEPELDGAHEEVHEEVHEHSGGAETGHVHSPAEEELATLFDAYLEAQQALVVDDTRGARSGLARLRNSALGASRAEGLDARLEPSLHGLRTALAEAETLQDLAHLRRAFHDASTHLLAIEGLAGNPTSSELRVVHCFMAFGDVGADWLQVGETVANPYLGSEMPRCGSLKRLSPVH